MIDRTASSRLQPSATDGDHDAPVLATKPTPKDAFEGAILELVADRRADESLRMFAASTGVASSPPSDRRDDVLYIGMNMDASGTGRPQAEAEASALVTMTKGHATRIERPSSSVIESAGSAFDTSTEEGC